MNSGQRVTDGVLCAPDSSAAQEVPQPITSPDGTTAFFNVSMRLEHRTNNFDQGIHVAETIFLGTSQDYTPVPYFCPDQYDLTLQIYGWLRDNDEVLTTEGSVQKGRFVALFCLGDHLTGILAARSNKAIRTWRQFLCDGAVWSDALEAA
jgi:hypothetical protein